MCERVCVCLCVRLSLITVTMCDIPLREVATTRKLTAQLLVLTSALHCSGREAIQQQHCGANPADHVIINVCLCLHVYVYVFVWYGFVCFVFGNSTAASWRQCCCWPYDALQCTARPVLDIYAPPRWVGKIPNLGIFFTEAKSSSNSDFEF